MGNYITRRRKNKMRLRTFAVLVVVALLAVASSARLAVALQHQPLKDKSDPISGEWDATFELQGTTVPVKFKFKLDGHKVTGTAESAHTGPGTLSKGSWVDNKLTFTLDFTTHESIALNGSFKDGKLVGEFYTEGMKGKWVAKGK
jgi:hypothetical protein